MCVHITIVYTCVLPVYACNNKIHQWGLKTYQWDACKHDTSCKTTYHMVTHHQHYLPHGHTPPTLLTTWSHTANTTYHMVTHHQHYLLHGHTSPTLLTTWSHITNTTYHMVTHHQHYLPHGHTPPTLLTTQTRCSVVFVWTIFFYIPQLIRFIYSVSLITTNIKIVKSKTKNKIVKVL